MDTDNLLQKFGQAKTFRELEEAVVNGFEDQGLPKDRKGIRDYIRKLNSVLPGIDQRIGELNPIKGNGILEILEDHLGLA